MKLPKIAFLTSAILLVTGCVTSSDLKAVQMQAERAQSDADNALATANEAKQLAADANSRSMRSEEMLNRGFKKSMYK